MKSPLRYPGGKQRLAPLLVSMLPPNIQEYREPMVGGGHVFFAAKTAGVAQEYWISDIYLPLINFYRLARDENENLRESLEGFKCHIEKCRLWVSSLKNGTLQGGDAFFIANRCTYSGTVEMGGFSPTAFHGRFTQSSIDRIKPLERFLKDVLITYGDYKTVLKADGDGVFIFLDPPYFDEGAGLYKHGKFNHVQLAISLKACPHKWMLTYGDHPVIRELYKDFRIVELDSKYNMSSRGKKATELVIMNYGY